MTESGWVNRPGVVEGVEAVRQGKEVLYLKTKLRFETEFKTAYYSDDNKVDEISIALPVDAAVNPGDVVALQIQFANPLGQRFVPALEVSTDEDVLDVMVEDGLIEEADAES